MAELSGLVENIQEVCALIRADATELAALNLADSPRKQANEVCAGPVTATASTAVLHIGLHCTECSVHPFLVWEGASCLLFIPDRSCERLSLDILLAILRCADMYY